MSADTATELLTYWLIPAEPAASYFCSLISDFAHRFDAPVFEPHVTLHVTTAANENPSIVLEHALANVKPPRLSITGIGSSEEFTKTLFIQFQSDETLVRLSARTCVPPRRRNANIN